MLKIKELPILVRMASKIDIKPAVEQFKELDVVKDGQKNFSDLTNEQKATVVFELIGAILPQIGKIAEDIPELVATHKGIPLDDAKELDAMEALKDVLGDSGVVDFFKSALGVKLKPGALACCQNTMTYA